MLENLNQFKNHLSSNLLIYHVSKFKLFEKKINNFWLFIKFSRSVKNYNIPANVKLEGTSKKKSVF